MPGLAIEVDRLERDNEALEDELYRRSDADDVADRFVALCRSVDAHVSIAHLPMQLEFEALAERLGVSRPWYR